MQETKKPEPATENTDSVVLAVFHAKVVARSGKGVVTAVVREPDGHCALDGVTNLVKAGFLDDRYYATFQKPDKLARLLGGQPVIVGQAACREWLSKHPEVKTILPSDIEGDALTGRAKPRNLQAR